jgi:nitroreductase
MSFNDLVSRRYSVRDYLPKPIQKADLEYVLNCARLAPSAVNKQPWHFYICKSDEAKGKLHKCYDREWFKTAPVIIIACVLHSEEWVRQNDRRPHGLVDVSIAVEHICLAATEKGLGTCWVCNFDAKMLLDLFDLPVDADPVALIPIGYPRVDNPEKKRKNLIEIVTEL